MITLYKPSSAVSRSLFAGGDGIPAVIIPIGGREITFACGRGSGMIQQIWMMPEDMETTRTLILRMYWDDCAEPAVECPLGDFFCAPTRDYKQISSVAVCTNPVSGYNCYWEMPFHKSFRFTLENRGVEDRHIRFNIRYCLDDISEGTLYFHAQFNRVNPLPYKEVHTILPRVVGRGAYAGTFLFQGVNANLWWGEGEVKFYMDGDKEFPTICTTGTEDYFLGSFDFNVNGAYTDYSTPFAGFARWPTDIMYHPVQRFGMYRFHHPDPVYFRSDLHITIQALGWRSEARYCPRQDDLATVAYFYLDHPAANRPALGSKNDLEII